MSENNRTVIYFTGGLLMKDIPIHTTCSMKDIPIHTTMFDLSHKTTPLVAFTPLGHKLGVLVKIFGVSDS